MSNSRLHGVLLSALAVVGLAAPASLAQEDAAEVYRLSLDQALRMALENNLDLVSARYVPELRLQDVETATSEFDAVFEANGNHSETERAATQLSTVTGSKTNSVSAGVGQTLKFGANYTAGFGLDKFEQTGPNVVAPTTYNSGFNFTFNLPILKGFGTETATERLVLAYSDLEISQTDLEGQAETVIESVEGAYWNVVAARRALGVAVQSLKRAEDLLELNRKRVEVGTLAPIEITQAEAGVASQEEGLIVSEIQLADAEDELRRLLAIPDSDPMWNMAIESSTRPVFETEDIDLEAAIDTAMASRPEMQSARQTLRNRELSERVAKRETRHQLDLEATYGPSGTSLDRLPIIEPAVGIVVPGESAEWGRSIARIFDGDVYTWRAGVVYRVPLGNRQARATYAKARIVREQSEVDLLNEEQRIRVEVRRAVRAVESGIKRVEAARINVVLQRKKLEAEQKKFENGMSTSFAVLEFQNDLSNAELSEIRARLDYIKALAALEAAKGTLLEARGLTLSTNDAAN